ncbi:F0F1 ATP synthase subunit A [Bacteroidota bacterium]
MKKRKSVSFFIVISVLTFLAGSYINAYGSEDEHDSEEAFNPGEMIMHHVSDGYSWHFFDGPFGTIYLPVILYSKDRGMEVFSSHKFYDEHHKVVDFNGYKLEHGHIYPVEESRSIYDISITKNVFAMFISVGLMFLVFFKVRIGYKRNEGQPPSGIQSFFEPIIIFVRDEVAKPNIGPKYEKYLPYLLTIFFFIWFNNMLGLLPGAANVTGNIAVTGTLAIFTFFVTQFSGNKSYWKHIFNTPGVPWWLKMPLPIMPIVELIGVFTKPFSLTVRLFANITAGHIIILSLFSLIFIFESIWIGPVSVLFAVFMMFLELFVALLQAFIFTILSAMYFGTAVEEHHEEEH